MTGKTLILGLVPKSSVLFQLIVVVVLTSIYKEEQEKLGKHNEHALFRLSTMLFYIHYTRTRFHTQHC